jgi:hypothetical protein
MNDNNPDILEQAGDFNLNVCQIVSYRMDGESNRTSYAGYHSYHTSN